MKATSRGSSSLSLSRAIRPIDCEASMLAGQKWIVCDESGHWAAALRVALARLPNAPKPRLYEVRTLIELSIHMDEHGGDLALIEVGNRNLAEVLQLLVRHASQRVRFVALLEDVVPQPDSAAAIVDQPGTSPVADLLWE